MSIFFSDAKVEKEAVRPRGIRDLPMPPVMDEPEPEPQPVKERKTPKIQKDDAQKFRRPKLVDVELFLMHM